MLGDGEGIVGKRRIRNIPHEKLRGKGNVMTALSEVEVRKNVIVDGAKNGRGKRCIWLLLLLFRDRWGVELEI